MSTSSSASSSPQSTSGVPAIVEPLHHPEQQAVLLKQEQPEMGKTSMGLGAQGLLLKKLAVKGKFGMSPSDAMVSPCSQKLANSKQRHYAKGKPLSLSASFQASKLGSSSGLKQTSSQPMSGENAAPVATNDKADVTTAGDVSVDL